MSSNIIGGDENHHQEKLNLKKAHNLHLKSSTPQDQYEDDMLVIDETNIGDFDDIEEYDPFKMLNGEADYSGNPYIDDYNQYDNYDDFVSSGYNDIDLNQYSDYDYDDMEDDAIRIDTINQDCEESYDNGYIEPISYANTPNINDIEPIVWDTSEEDTLESNQNEEYDDGATSDYLFFDEEEAKKDALNSDSNTFENRQNRIVSNYYNPDDYSDSFDVFNAIEAADLKENHQEHHNDTLGSGYEDKDPGKRHKKKRKNTESTIIGESSVTSEDSSEDVSFIGALKNLFIKIFNFNGYTGVKEFWLSIVWIFIIAIVIGLISVIPVAGGIISSIGSLVLFIAQTSLICRRFNDAGISWWTPLIATAISVIGVIVICVTNMTAIMSLSGSNVSFNLDNLGDVIATSSVMLGIGLILSVVNLILSIIIYISQTGKFEGNMIMKVIYIVASSLAAIMIVLSSGSLIGGLVNSIETSNYTVDIDNLNGADAGVQKIDNIEVDFTGYVSYDPSLIGDLTELEDLFAQYGTLDNVACYSNGNSFIAVLSGTSDIINSMTPDNVNEVDSLDVVEYQDGYGLSMSNENYELMLFPGNNESNTFIMVVTNNGVGIVNKIINVVN